MQRFSLPMMQALLLLRIDLPVDGGTVSRDEGVAQIYDPFSPEACMGGL